MIGIQREREFGALDARFLARSVGLLNPGHPLMVELGSTEHPAAKTSVAHVISLLKEHRAGCALITREGLLVGVFTERDVLKKVALEPLSVLQSSVEALMTKDPHAASITSTLGYALNVMAEGGFRHLPLVDEENIPVGIISMQDIIAYISRALLRV